MTAEASATRKGAWWRKHKCTVLRSAREPPRVKRHKNRSTSTNMDFRSLSPNFQLVANKTAITFSDTDSIVMVIIACAKAMQLALLLPRLICKMIIIDKFKPQPVLTQ